MARRLTPDIARQADPSKRATVGTTTRAPRRSISRPRNGKVAPLIRVATRYAREYWLLGKARSRSIGSMKAAIEYDWPGPDMNMPIAATPRITQP
ncbi:hypothetical protein BH23PLA1_BH23PLA1_16590 [soil metagenome]